MAYERLFGGSTASSTGGVSNPFFGDYDYSNTPAPTFNLEKEKQQLTKTTPEEQVKSQIALPSTQKKIPTPNADLYTSVGLSVPEKAQELDRAESGDQEALRAQFYKLAPEKKRALAEMAMEDDKGNVIFGSSNDRSLAMFEQLKLPTQEFKKLTQTQLSAPTGQEVPLSQYRPDEGEDVLQAFGKGAIRGSIGTVKNLGSFVEGYLPGLGPDVGTPLKMWGLDTEEQHPEFKRSKSSAASLGEVKNIGDFAKMISGIVGEATPMMVSSIAASVATAGAGLAPQVGGFGASFVQEAGNVREQLMQMGVKPTDANTASAIYAIPAAALDMYSGGVAGKKILEGAAGNVVKEGIKEEMLHALANSSAGYIKSFLAEGGTELIQQFSENATYKFFNNNYDLTSGLPEAFLGGGFSGFGFEAIGNVFSGDTVNAPIVQKRTNTEVNEIEKKEENQNITRLEEQKRSLEATKVLAEKLIERYPNNTRLPEILADTNDTLQTVGASYSNALNQYLSNNKEEVVKTPNLEISVSQTPTGEWIAQGKAMVRGVEFEVPFSQSEITENSDGALVDMIIKLQDWVTEQTNNTKVDDIAGLASISENLDALLNKPSLKDVLSQPEKAMQANEMTFEEFSQQFKDQEDLSQLSDFYGKARSNEAVKALKFELEKPIRELAQDLGVRTEWVQHIATVDGKRALGSFQGDVIRLLQSPEGRPIADETTVYHEIGHAYFRKMMTKNERSAVLDQVKKEHGITNDAQAEEQLVEDLKKQADAKTARTDKYGKFLSALLEIVKRLTNFVKGDKVAKFYEDVLSKKTPKAREAFTKEEETKRTEEEAANKKKIEETIMKQIKKEAGVDLSEFIDETKFRLAPEEKNLVVLHNTNLENLQKSVALGGLPVPSIGITKNDIPFENFGQVTLIGTPEMIDPMRDSRNKVFSGDAYSPRVPRERHIIDRKNATALFESLSEGLPKDLVDLRGSDLYQSIMDAKDATVESVQNDAFKSNAVLAKFLDEQNVSYKPVQKDLVSRMNPVEKSVYESDISKNDFTYEDLKKGTAFYEKAKPIIDKGIEQSANPDVQKEIFYNENGDINLAPFDNAVYGATKARKSQNELDYFDTRRSLQSKVEQVGRDEFNTWVADKFKDVLGEKVLDRGRRQVPYTLENIVQAMSGATRGVEEGIFGNVMTFARTKAKMSKSLRSLEDIKKMRDQFVERGSAQDLYDMLSDEYGNLASELESSRSNQGYSENVDNLGNAILSYNKGKKTEEAMRQSLESFSFTPTNEQVAKIKELADGMVALKQDYIEAKPQRAVYLDEFTAVLVPNEEMKFAKEVLQGTPLENKIYAYSDNSERIRLVKDITERTNTAFRLDENGAPNEEDTTKVDLLNRALQGALNKDLTIENTPKFKSLLDFAKKTEEEMKGKYGASFLQTTTSLIENVEEKMRDVLPKVTITPTKEVEVSTGEKTVTRVMERMKEEYDELADPQQYQQIHIKEQVEKALQLASEDYTKATQVAMGFTDAPEYERAAANIALSQAALEEGNYELANQLIKNRSLRQTELGQAIVMEKASVTDNSPQRFLRELLAARYDAVGERARGFKGAIEDISKRIRNGKQVDPTRMLINEKVKEARKYISPRKKFDIQQAQDFISSLACK